MNPSTLNSRLHNRAVHLLPALTLALWSGVIFRLKSSGLLDELQNPSYQPISIGTAIACLLLALTYPLLCDAKQQPQRPHWPRLTLATSLLALPIALFIALPQNNPTAGFLARRYTSATSNANLYQLLGIDQNDLLQDLQTRRAHAANDEVLELDMLELNFIANHSSLRKSYDQTTVTLSGQWLPDANGKTDSFRLVQMIMFCCAADAKVLGINVKGIAPDGKNGIWLDVRGTLHFDPTGNPTLTMQQAKPEDNAPPADLPLPTR